MAATDPRTADPILPRAEHVAIIMDGNGRWAMRRGWPRLVGHRKGAERVKEIVRAAPGLGIRYLTIYAFSTENWKRSTEEVLGLMSIFARYIEREADRLSAEGVRMRFIGDRSRLDAKLQRLMLGIEARTAHHTRLHLTVTYHKIGRTVAEVEIAWEVKEDLTKVKAEHDRPKAGRKARRDGTEEKPVLAFPSSGSIKDTQPWDRIAREHAPKLEGRHTPDLRQLTDAFRKWCDSKSINLDASSIEKTFTTWCKSYSAR